MSYTFTVKSRRKPTVGELWRAVGLGDVRCLDSLDDAPLPAGTFRFFRDGISARAIEVSRAGSEYSVRVLAISALEDMDLGVRFAEAFGRRCAAPVQTEADDTVPADDLRSTLGDRWFQRHSHFPLAAFSRSPGARPDASIPGVQRTLYVGPNFMARLRRKPEPEACREVVETLRRLQWIDTQHYSEASPMQATSPAGRTARFIVLTGDPQLLEVQDLVAVAGEPPIFIEGAHVGDVVGSGIEWFGERHALVEGVSKARWRQVRNRARKREVFPLD